MSGNTTDNNESVTETPSVGTDDLEQFESVFFQERTEAGTEEQVEQGETETDSQEEGGEETETGEVTESEEEEASPEEETEETDEPDGDEESEEETEDEPQKEEEGSKPKKKTAQDRINELTAARRAEERRAVEAEKRLERLEQMLMEKGADKDGPESKTTEDKADEPEAPSPDDRNEDGSPKYKLGEFDPSYIRDLTRHTIEQEREAERIATEERTRIEAEQEAAKARQENWQGSIEEASTKYEDFQESVATLESTFQGIDESYGQYLADTIMESEYGTDVLYYLSQNPSEAQSIVDSGAAKATLALGRLEAQFASLNSKTEEKPAKKVTKAKAPPKTTTRGTGGKFSVSPDTDNLDDFEKIFLKP